MLRTLGRRCYSALMSLQMPSRKSLMFQRKPCSVRCLVKFCLWLVGLALTGILLMFFTPTRNLLLSPVLPGLWRELPTSSLLYYTHMTPERYNVGTCPARCEHKIRPKTQRSDLNDRKVKYYEDMLVKAGVSYADTKPEWYFWPLLSRSEKAEMLHALDVLVEVLQSLQVEYFFIGGSMLGAVRHRSVIPWDDDLDVAVSARHWQKVKDALCCLEGFTTVTRDNMHWKMFPDSGYVVRTAPETRFPFVDIFFYDSDDTHVWAITSYVKTSLLVPKSDVYPLKMASLEDKLYPIPRETEKLLRLEFGDLGVCVSTNHLHRFNRPLNSEDVKVLPCKQLAHLYPVYDSLDS